MAVSQTIGRDEFFARYKRTGERKSAIFGSRKALMEEIYATGSHIYCDMSYYVHEDTFHRVNKVGDHFQCEIYKKFEEWRECHYYSKYKDEDGNEAWLMTGGKYD